jgi:uncharacterized membrane protein
MCFSATGSFGVAAVLAGIGTVAMAQEKAPSRRMLGLVPLLFAFQQVAEGVVWLTIDHPGQRWLLTLSVAVFLGFALVVWPIWVPISLWAGERNARRRRILRALIWVGIGVGIYAGAILVRGRPTARVAGHSIAYGYADAGPALVLALYLPMYLIPALLPFFVSTISRARLMGTVLGVSLIATFIIERQTLTSVWCFFGAILSAVIVLGISEDHRLVIEPA